MGWATHDRLDVRMLASVCPQEEGVGAPCGCGGGGRWLTSLQRGPAPMIATGDVVSPLALVQREGKGGEGGGGRRGRGREGEGEEGRALSHCWRERCRVY